MTKDVILEDEKAPHSILLVEDDAPDAALVKHKVQKLWPDCEIIPVKSLEKAQEEYQKQDVDMVLLDLNLPDGFGPQTVTDARKFVTVPIVVITGMVTNITVDEALKNGANNVVPKKDLTGDDFVNILEQNAK